MFRGAAGSNRAWGRQANSKISGKSPALGLQFRAAEVSLWGSRKAEHITWSRFVVVVVLGFRSEHGFVLQGLHFCMDIS